MKNLVKSKPFITAGIFAAVCLSILLICFFLGKGDKFEFVPDEPDILSGPIESWTENAASFIAGQEIEELRETKTIIPDDPVSDDIDSISDDFVFIPDEMPTFEPEPNTQIALTTMPEMPEPPELPETAYREKPESGGKTQEDVEAHKALDPKLTNPNVKPDGTPVTTKPAENTTQSNQVHGEGGIYFPGVGWLPYLGPNIVEESGSDGDWSKQIGSMGGK